MAEFGILYEHSVLMPFVFSCGWGADFFVPHRIGERLVRVGQLLAFQLANSYTFCTNRVFITPFFSDINEEA